MASPSFAVVASTFNEKITDRLLTSCLKTLRSRGAATPWVVRVPGAFEIPWTANELARSGDFDVVICLGCVLAGETEQNRHLARSTVQQIQRISIETGVPCVLGVITPTDERQALARTKGSLDRGKEAAMAALEMARVRRDLRRSHPARRLPDSRRTF
jgi:6,7-dimethyl-8-ribityllumazine synthase